MTGKNNYPDSLFHLKRKSVFESKQCLRSMQGSVNILILLLYNNKGTNTLIAAFIIQTYILSTRTSTKDRKSFWNQNCRGFFDRWWTTFFYGFFWLSWSRKFNFSAISNIVLYNNSNYNEIYNKYCLNRLF